MKRFARNFLRIATAVSFFLCLSFIVLLVRGYWMADWVTWMDLQYDRMQTVSFSHVYNSRFGVAVMNRRFQNSIGGTAAKSWEREPISSPRWRAIKGNPPRPSSYNRRARSFWSCLGMEAVYQGHDGPYEIVSALIVPHWMLIVITAIGPVCWVIRFRLRRRIALRKQRGICVNCGYDLRATPDQCPECGSRNSL